MTAEILNILSQYGQTTSDQIKSVVPKKTGRTAASVRFEVKDEGSKATLRILGRPYFMTVQTGRKPTPQFTKPSKEFVKAILEWLGENQASQGKAYAIARSIHQKGTKLWRAGGNQIISNIINESLVEKISKDVLSQFAKEYLTSVVNVIGNK